MIDTSSASATATAPAPPAVAAGIAPDSAAAKAIVSDNEYAKYLLHQRNEMVPVLKGLVEHVSQITMFFNEGRDMVLTSLVRFDDNGLVMDFGPSPDLNRKALAAEKLFCVTQLDKVKIQFLLRGVRQIDESGQPAFFAGFPESMLRLQRREYYRLSLPLTRPLSMTVPFPEVDGTKRPVVLPVGDISGGGLAMINLPESLRLQPGMEFAGCRLDLPEVGQVTINIRVCSLMEVRTRSGGIQHRAGCEFIKLPGPMLTLIQRYIIKIERERKARESGLG